MSFQKFIGIPFARHNDLLNIEKEQREQKSSLGTVKQASNAIAKNQETQEFLQRKQEYKEKKEDIPKSLNKEIPKKAVTNLPPPPPVKKRKVANPSNFAFPIVKKFNDNRKRTPKPKKVIQSKGLNNWKFISED